MRFHDSPAWIGGAACLLLSLATGPDAAAAANPIPPAMQVVWSPGVEGGIPDVPVLTRLEPGDLPAPPEDAAPAIQAAMSALRAPGAVLLPQGTFRIRQPLRIPSGVVLRGRGAAGTHLLIDTPDAAGWYSPVVIKGEGAETDVAAAGPVAAGARCVELVDTTGIRAGQLAWLFMHNDPEVMYPGRPDWNASWAGRAVGQMFRIESVEGNSIHLDRPVRLDYPAARRPGVRIYSPARRAGLEDLHLMRVDSGEGGLLTLETAEDCWVRGCEFENVKRTHIGMRRCRNITVESNYIHHGQRYSGSHAYGVSTDWSTTDCLIQNNILSVLRHAISASIGANGCVWAYNYLRGQTDDSDKDRLRDISLHGNYPYMNLFEGNVAEFAASSDWWGAAGPLNTFFRNRFDPSPEDPSGWNPPLQVQYHSHRQVIVGNSMLRGQGIWISPECRDVHLDGNLNEGTVNWQGASCRTLPPSLYLSGPPEFWGDKPWPGIGADVDAAATGVTLPAEDWYRAIQAAGCTIPFRERRRFAAR